MAIPIIVMTRNEGEFLQQCVHSILSTVSVAIEVYIIDNASNDTNHLKILDELQKLEHVNIIKNKKNLWILGLNKHLSEIREKHKSKYFYLTDGDIDFSKCKAKPCWLSYSIEQMDNNVALGKLGMSLSWEYLRETPRLHAILEQEQNLYSEDKKINDLYVSYIDTTATLFRWDWSIEKKSLFYPDHMRYLRPELYSCRTPTNIVVEHLGWQKYGIGDIPPRQLEQKVKCFLQVGGYVKDEVLAQVSPLTRISYKTLHKPILNLWILRRYYYLFKYVFSTGRRHFQGQG